MFAQNRLINACKIYFIWKSVGKWQNVCETKRITEKCTIYEENRNQVKVNRETQVSQQWQKHSSNRVVDFFLILFARYFHLVTPTMLTGFC